MAERFFFDWTNPETGQISRLSAVESHQLTTVLRIRPCTQIRIFGNGLEFEGEVENCSSPVAQVRLLRQIASAKPPNVTIHSAMPWLKHGHSELAAEKLTELGVSHIWMYSA